MRTLHVESRAAVLIGHILLKRGDFVRKLRIFRPKKSATRFPIITKLRKSTRELHFRNAWGAEYTREAHVQRVGRRVYA